ncbi:MULTISPECIES: helix-turn-helix domain-containing protein [unclassified Nitrosomonas]|jgi:Fis family transcriptional regulator|uniref:helix-turn-helix domain-containing protein n=1 Tax=unclassified Nitrosomonas TaxID=2609265 RepID=UPI00088B2802|nr:MULTISPECIES: helix-turn-helix domain-containing protein [unclassified Nitrosomonas]SDH90645.1 Fis family transcriptional regulator, factor for inversion stimulation protein [Nitrosomonas sp. Nm132]SDZ03852.1 Fis family transcriptional regulator, factor for inversion stimulation protein [Nitrosomonas sp. Nm58]
MNTFNDNEIASCLRKSIEAYLKDLDGERPCSIYEMVIRSVERPLFELAMEYAGGNQTKAAELLGINRNTLRNRLAKQRIK